MSNLEMSHFLSIFVYFYLLDKSCQLRPRPFWILWNNVDPPYATILHSHEHQPQEAYAFLLGNKGSDELSHQIASVIRGGFDGFEQPLKPNVFSLVCLHPRVGLQSCEQDVSVRHLLCEALTYFPALNTR